MIPSVLLLGERGAGKGYVANVIAAHSEWMRESKGLEVAPPEEADVYQIGQRAGLRSQTLTALPESLATVALFGAKRGAYTDLREDRPGLFDSSSNRRSRGGSPDPFDAFLDEIGDAPLGVQAALLEVLETRTFRPLGSSYEELPRTTDARIICATNKDLELMVKNGQFRADLYDRLSWMRIVLPPLREQLDQLQVIIKRANTALCQKYKIENAEPSEPDIRWAETYEWPGNVRELVQVLWMWHLYRPALSLSEVVEMRNAAILRADETLGSVLEKRIFEELDFILAGKRAGYRTYGQLGHEVQRLAYGAIYQYNRRRELKNDELKLLFTSQNPTNVRKQISQNRPKPEKE